MVHPVQSPGSLTGLVLILVGSLEHLAHVRKKFATAVDLNKCLDQIKLPMLLKTCAFFICYELTQVL